MSDNASIEKLRLVIGDKRIELSLGQARDLQRVLNELFREPLQVQTVPVSPVFVPVPYPEPARNPYGPYWETTYCGGTAVCAAL